MIAEGGVVHLVPVGVGVVVPGVRSRRSLCRFLLLLFFLLLHLLDDLIDHLHPLDRVHACQCLQAVLQFHGRSMRIEFLKDFGPFIHVVVVFTFLVEQSQCSGITFLRLDKFLLLPVELAQMQPHDALLHTVARALLHTVLVSPYGMRGVFLGEVDITDGVVHLVEIFLVLWVARHGLELTDHTLAVGSRHDLRHFDPRVESQFVRRVLPRHLLECLVCLCVVARGMVELSKEEVHTGFLIGSLRFTYGVFEIGNCLGVLFLSDLAVSQNGVPDRKQALRNAVACSSAEQVFRVVIPLQLSITLGLENPCLCDDVGLAEVESLNICEG